MEGVGARLTPTPLIAFCACVLTWPHFPCNGHVPRPRGRFRTKGG